MTTLSLDRTRWPVLWAVILVAVSLAGLIILRKPMALAIPVALAALPVLSGAVFRRPVWVLAAFLLVIVNLDFIKMGGASLDVLLSMALLYVLLLRNALTREASTARDVEVLFLLFLATALISVVVSVIPALSVKRFGRECVYLVLFAFLVRHSWTAGEKRLLLRAVLFSSVIPCVLGIAGYVFGIDAFLGQELYLENLYQGEARVRSTLSHPVTFSLYLGVVGLLTLTLILDRRRESRLLLLPLFALQMTALYLTYGRSGWIAFLAGLVVLLVVRGHRRFLLLGFPVAGLLAWKVIPTLQQRLLTVTATGEENSLLWRLGLWAYALDIYPRKPVFGSGIGTFLEYVDYLQGFGPHQTWIGLLVETGIVGAVAYLLLMLGVAWALRRRLRDPQADPVLVQAALAVWVCMMVGSLGANAFGLPSVTVYFWTLMGMALGCAALPARLREQPRELPEQEAGK